MTAVAIVLAAIGAGCCFFGGWLDRDSDSAWWVASVAGVVLIGAALTIMRWWA